MAGQTASAEHGRRALALAGRALDPNTVGGPSLALGQLLLRESYIASARAICGDPALDSVEAGAAALERRSDGKEPAKGSRDAAATLGAASVPSYAALLGAQMEVARLVDEATGDRRLPRARRRAWWIIGLTVITVTGTLVSATIALGRPWESYTWVASSAWEGFSTVGTLAEHDAEHDLVVHTDEQQDPWVLVDLLATRTIRKVLLINRMDCCSDRGLPLTLEVARDDRQFVPIATRTEPFDSWETNFPPQKARYVRLRAKGVTIIHLRDIQIR